MRYNVQDDAPLAATELALPPGKRQVQRERRYEEIVNASLQVFAREGYSGFSLRKVAAEAGVRLNTVQHYFGDLNALLFVTIKTRMQSYVTQYQLLALDEQLPARDRLEAVLDDAIAEVRKPEICTFFLEIWTLANHDEAICGMLKDVYGDYKLTLGELARQIEPSLSDSEAAVVGTMIAAWLEGLVVMARFEKPGMPPLHAVAVRIKSCILSVFGQAGRGAHPPAMPPATPPGIAANDR
jgi:AcrR family transcriptional regulator